MNFKLKQSGIDMTNGWDYTFRVAPFGGIPWARSRGLPSVFSGYWQEVCLHAQLSTYIFIDPVAFILCRESWESI